NSAIDRYAYIHYDKNIQHRGKVIQPIREVVTQPEDEKRRHECDDVHTMLHVSRRMHETHAYEVPKEQEQEMGQHWELDLLSAEHHCHEHDVCQDHGGTASSRIDCLIR